MVSVSIFKGEKSAAWKCNDFPFFVWFDLFLGESSVANNKYVTYTRSGAALLLLFNHDFISLHAERLLL